MGIEVSPECGLEYHRLIQAKELIENGGIPDILPQAYYERFHLFDDNRLTIAVFHLREAVIRNCGFVTLTKPFLDELADVLRGRVCFDVLAGGGRLAWELNERGCTIYPSDNFKWKEHKDSTAYYFERIFDVEDIDCHEVIERDVDEGDVVMIVWPHDWAKPIAERAFKKGAKVLYIGELGGCCAEEEFCDGFEFDYIKTCYRTYGGLHDELYWVSQR